MHGTGSNKNQAGHGNSGALLNGWRKQDIKYKLFLNEVKSRVLHVSQCVRFNKFKSNTQSEFGPT